LTAVRWARRRNIAETTTLAPILCKYNYIQRHSKLENIYLTNMTRAPEILLKPVSLFTSPVVPIYGALTMTICKSEKFCM
jgi:hypothetical protein